MNVAEMVKNVNVTCSPITNMNSIIIRFLDRGQKVVGSKRDWFWLRQYGYGLTTVSGTQFYSLSPLVDISKTVNIYDTGTPQYIRPMGESEFRMREPGPTATGTPYLYRVRGFSPVQNQPSSASALALTSSSASDTAVDVFVQGLDGSDVLFDEKVTLTGTTPAATTYSYTKIMVLSKDAETVGKVTITSNAAAVTNVVIAPKDRFVQHPVIGLFEIPDGNKDIYYDFTMKLQTLSADDDSSLIPEQYHDAIELYAQKELFKHLNNVPMAQQTMAEFERRVKDMIDDDIQPKGIMTRDSYWPDYLVPAPQFGRYFPPQGF